MQPNRIAVQKLGNHNGNKRVWIATKQLKKSFVPGERADVEYNSSKKEVRIRKASSFLSGNITISKRKDGTPIIDLKNKNIEKTLGRVEKIEVLYFKDEVVIRVARVEHFKEKRAEKKGLNTFELFCGAGTLSYFFKEAGFNVKGGLEINEDYLALFHKNNPGDEIFSISTNIEDIHTSYFPKDIDVVLSGIPCTPFSGSNLKLKSALKNKREGKEYDENEIKKVQSGEALTFYVLMAIKAMNPRVVVVEEVVEYSTTSASLMLRSILENMGYNITETVSQGKHTKRERWCLVANMGNSIDLSGLAEDDNKTIEDFLEVGIDERNWKTPQEHKRVAGMIRKGLGIRSVLPSDKKSNTFTTHGTRHTEPVLKHPTKDLYSDFTNREIANIHGISKDFILDERKTVNRQILGQGVTDMFKDVASRIKRENKSDNVVKYSNCNLMQRSDGCNYYIKEIA